jgi:hypothetical protein
MMYPQPGCSSEMALPLLTLGVQLILYLHGLCAGVITLRQQLRKLFAQSANLHLTKRQCSKSARQIPVPCRVVTASAVCLRA